MKRVAEEKKDELTVEERNLLSVAYKNLVGKIKINKSKFKKKI